MNFMIRLVRTIFKVEPEPERIGGKNISKIRWRHWRRRRVQGSCLPCWHLISQIVVVKPCLRNGFHNRWCKDLAKDVGRVLLGRRLASPGPTGCCAFAHIIQRLGWLGSTDSTASSFSSSSRRSPSLLHRQWGFRPFVPAETLKACALIGLHLMAAELACDSTHEEGDANGGFAVLHDASCGGWCRTTAPRTLSDVRR